MKYLLLPVIFIIQSIAISIWMERSPAFNRLMTRAKCKTELDRFMYINYASQAVALIVVGIEFLIIVGDLTCHIQK